MILQTSSPQSRLSGFSLVEVTIALGVFAFAVLGLMGMLPIALQTHRDAKLDTVLSQIKQRLAAEVLLTDGANLANLSEDVKIFDVEGRELTADIDVVYRAKITLEDFQIPGTSLTSTSLQRIVFYALQDPVGNLILNAPPNGAILVSRAENAPTQNP
jgi:uncharacterized protein (TIGR02598 family)